MEKAGKAESSKGKRVIKQYLGRVHKVGTGNELQDAVGKAGDQSGDRAVPVADQTDDQHTE